MAVLTIRNLPEHVHRGLSRAAFENGRSPEDEAGAALGERFSELSENDRQEAWREAIASIQAALRVANQGELPTGLVDDLLVERRRRAAAELEDLERRVSIGRNASDGL